MPDKVKRYNPDVREAGFMDEWECGKYVEYDDYAKLSAELADAREMKKSSDAVMKSALEKRDRAENDRNKAWAELAALRDGFDPKVKLPEDGVSVLIATPRSWHPDLKQIAYYSDGEWLVGMGTSAWGDPVTRWWPLPGGAK